MSPNTVAALKAAHSPAARKKAMKTMLHLAKLRKQMAQQHNISASYFTKDRLMETAKRLNIPLSAIPLDLFKPFKKSIRDQLLAQRSNGSSGGSSFPLDAIPERKKHQTNGDRAPWGSKNPSKKGHPNGALIEKILDRIGDPKTTQKVVERLMVALEKLLG